MMPRLVRSATAIWTVGRRELQALLHHPTGYVLLVVFAGVNAFFFFRQAYFVGIASLRPMLDLLPWIFLFFVPAVTMRALAEDNRGGMLEVVLANPLTELELLLGKYLGALLFLSIALGLTLPIPIGLALGADMQWGVIIAQYVGAVLLAAGLSGVGIWASSLTRSQITAFILGVAVMFVLVLIGLDPLLVGLPPALGAVAARIGVLSHFASIGRGAIDLRDVVYFLSLAGVFLALAYGAIMARRLARGGLRARQLRLGVGLTTAILVVLTILGGYIGGRLDLTPANAYTLSDATRTIVRNLDDIVTIKVFASDELPTQAALLEREMNDLLRDLRSAGGGKVRIVRRDPTTDEAARSDAQSLGIGPVQFNVIGASELQVKEGYLGLAIQYRDASDAIRFVDRTDDLEYRLVSTIRSLSRPSKPVVGIVHESQGPGGASLGALEEALRESYTVRTISLSDSTQPAADVTTLILASAPSGGMPGAPPMLPEGAAERIGAFFRRGGSALVAASGVELSPQFPMAMPRPVAWNAILQPFAVSIRSDVVYDLAAGELIPTQSAALGLQVLRRYPFFIRAQSTGLSVVSQDVSSVTIPWPSSIDTNVTAATAGDTSAAPTAAEGSSAPRRWTVTPLLVTTEASRASDGPTPIDPAREFPQDSLAPRILAVQVAPAIEAGDDSLAAHGRLVVVGNIDFMSDRFGGQAPQNLLFALNAIDWLAQDESLIAIRSKNPRPPALAFSSVAAREGVKYGNMIGIPVLIAVAGVVHLARRRRRTREPYAPLRIDATRTAGVPA
jgi:ABC-type uncharacterized transport system involved in gliding motility auxiliary subunit